jgi:hypothetical protein
VAVEAASVEPSQFCKSFCAALVKLAVVVARPLAVLPPLGEELEVRSPVLLKHRVVTSPSPLNVVAFRRLPSVLPGQAAFGVRGMVVSGALMVWEVRVWLVPVRSAWEVRVPAM